MAWGLGSGVGGDGFLRPLSPGGNAREQSSFTEHLSNLARCGMDKDRSFDSRFTSLGFLTVGGHDWHRDITVTWYHTGKLAFFRNDYDRLQIKMHVAVRLQWFDPALFNTSFACDDIYLPSLMQFEPWGQWTQMKRRVLSIAPCHLHPGYEESMPEQWCMSFLTEVETIVEWNYDRYPFDTQSFVVHMTLDQPESHFVGCENPSNYGFYRNGLLLKGSEADKVEEVRKYLVDEEWSLPSDWVTARVLDFTTGEPLQNGTGSVMKPQQCNVKFHLRRNPTVFLVKSMVLDILIELAGIAATFIDPRFPPHFAARCTIIVTCMLMAANKMGSRTELSEASARVGYMTTLDWISIFNIFILFVALAFSVRVHLLMNRNCTSLALYLDHAMRIGLPVFYICGVTSFIIYITDEDRSLAVLAFSMSWGTLFIVATVGTVWVHHRRRLRQIQKIVDELLVDCLVGDDGAAGHTAGEHSEKLDRAFDALDTDHSGVLETDEAWALLRAMLPTDRQTLLPQGRRRIKKMRDVLFSGDSRNGLTREAFKRKLESTLKDEALRRLKAEGRLTRSSSQTAGGESRRDSWTLDLRVSALDPAVVASVPSDSTANKAVDESSTPGSVNLMYC